MAIRDWHPGQLGVLWVGGAGLEWVFYSLSEDIGTALNIIIVIGLIVIPLVLLIVTWKWFGGRPRSRDR